MHLGKPTARRYAATLFAALACLLGLAACTAHAPERAAPTPVPTDGRPNIVFVLTDDLSTNLLPYMPHVQALTKSGVSFENYFVVDSLCCPSRSAIFTGLYPHDNGVFTNSGADGGYQAYNRFGNPRRSFAVALQAAGYQTAFMGKYLNGYPVSDPPAPGWNVWDVTANGYPEYNYPLNENGSVTHYGSAPSDYLTHVLASKADQFIQDSRYTGKPFALEVATFAPHTPRVPAPMDRGTFPTTAAPRVPAFAHQPANAPSWFSGLGPLTPYDIERIDHGFQRRVEAVQAVDRMVGHLEGLLAQQHQLANTYFVFSSDNGYHMGEYGLMPGKQTAFDTDIRVPLIVAGPGVPVGRTIDAMASSIDLAPTFLQIAGARPSDQPDGTSLLDLLHGGRPPADWQRAVLIEHHGPQFAPQDPDVQSARSGAPPSYEAMRTADSLYVEYVTGEREYYDLRRDPSELHNVVSNLPPRRLAALHTRLMALAHCHGTAECQQAAAPNGRV